MRPLFQPRPYTRARGKTGGYPFPFAVAVNRRFPEACREATRQIRSIMQERTSEARWIWGPDVNGSRAISL